VLPEVARLQGCNAVAGDPHQTAKTNGLHPELGSLDPIPQDEPATVQPLNETEDELLEQVTWLRRNNWTSERGGAHVEQPAGDAA
jgi:hypothetical protein